MHIMVVKYILIQLIESITFSKKIICSQVNHIYFLEKKILLLIKKKNILNIYIIIMLLIIVVSVEIKKQNLKGIISTVLTELLLQQLIFLTS